MLGALFRAAFDLTETGASAVGGLADLVADGLDPLLEAGTEVTASALDRAVPGSRRDTDEDVDSGGRLVRVVGSGVRGVLYRDPVQVGVSAVGLSSTATRLVEAGIAMTTSPVVTTMSAVGLERLADLTEDASSALRSSIRAVGDGVGIEGQALWNRLPKAWRLGSNGVPVGPPVPVEGSVPSVGAVEPGAVSADRLKGALSRGLAHVSGLQRPDGSWDTPFVGGAAQTSFGVIALSCWECAPKKFDALAVARFLVRNQNRDGGFGWSAAPTRSTPHASQLCGYALECLADMTSEHASSELDVEIRRASDRAYTFAKSDAEPDWGPDAHYRIAASLVLDNVAPEKFDTLPNIPWLGRMSGLGYDLMPQVSELIVGVRVAVVTLLEAQASRQGGALAKGVGQTATILNELFRVSRIGSPGERVRQIEGRQAADGSWDWVLVNTAVNLVALKALDAPADAPVVRKGLDFVAELTGEGDGRWTRGDTWDTATLAGTLGALSTVDTHGARRGVLRLLEAQRSDGRWSFALRGRLGDNDTTAVVLGCLARFRSGFGPDDPLHRRVSESIARAAEGLLGQQQPSGGWGAFSSRALADFGAKPAQGLDSSFVDAATPSVTARVVSALAVCGHPPDGASTNAIERGLAFLERAQDPSGAWWCRWFAGWFPSMAWVLPALRRSGRDPHGETFMKARRYLISLQNADGGFGETAEADVDPRLAGKGPSTPFQTACAMIALTSSLTESTDAGYSAVLSSIDAAAAFLLGREEDGAWSNGVPLYTATRGVEYYESDALTTTMVLNALHVYEVLRRKGPEEAVSAFTM